MTEKDLYDYLLIAGFVSAGVVFISLFFVVAPYGRHTRAGWGPTLPNRLGWIIMETPAVFSILYFCLTAKSGSLGIVWIFLALWQTHYVYRTYIFPFLLQSRGKRMPLMIPLSAIVFNVFNGYLNGRHLAWAAETYSAEWLRDPRFIVGAALFLAGFAINIYSDQVLIRLRQKNDTGYSIPQGGLYRWISCPNYFGELIEWCGWAILTWSVAGLVFAVWTAANLAPRAISNHRWYREQFPDYPASRKALVPFLI
ncbi:MAG: DUF1295 domain-containing protein [Candidatus Hydrogenedentes bacterium]|nr:DUF1295 domain-containing protein [Candidatus Hydrogenedentota bacterium]